MNQNEKKIVYTFDERDTIVREMLSLMAQYRIFAFVGPLGAGKTTLVGEVLRASGVTGPVTSPTFAYVNHYENNLQQQFYHFDLYRIASVQEFQEHGFDEYLNQSNTWVFIEWPEVIEPLLQQGVCWIYCDYGSALDERVVVIKAI